MRIPDTDHVARTCKASSCDPQTRSPTPASFEFRFRDGEWQEAYLSVNWLEYLQSPEGGDLPAGLRRLREFLFANADRLPLIKPTAKGALAVVPVQDIHALALTDVGTVLACRHEPQGEGDPHGGVIPEPGVDTWPRNRDAAAHLAVQQSLFQAMCHWEPGILK